MSEYTISVLEEISKTGKKYDIPKPFSVTIPEWLYNKDRLIIRDEMYFRHETEKALLLLNENGEKLWLPKSQITITPLIVAKKGDEFHRTPTDDGFY